MDRKEATTNTLLGIVALAGIPVMTLGPDLFPQSKQLFFWGGLVLILGALAAIVAAHRAGSQPDSAGDLAVPGPPHSAIFDLQVQEMRQVEEFLGRKTELELREAFDFDRIVPYNLEACRAQLLGKELDEDAAADFQLCGSHLDPKRLMVTRAGEDSMARFDRLPGRVGAVDLSAKHFEACRLLQHFADSAHLPADVVTALKSFGSAVDQNVGLLMDVLDEALQEDPKNITEYDQPGPYEGRVAHRYTKRFAELKPLAAAVTAAIRRNLRIA